MARLADRRPVLFALGIAALVLAFTTDERVFGLVTDGQIMTRTAYAMSALGEIGIARGHPVDIARPGGDAVTRYGMGPSLVRVPLTALAGPFENAFGLGSSQTLFVLEQILLVLLAAARGGPPRARRGRGSPRNASRVPRRRDRVAAVGVRGVRLVRASSGGLRRRRVRVRGAPGHAGGRGARRASVLAAFAGAARRASRFSRSRSSSCFSRAFSPSLWFGSEAPRACDARSPLRRLADCAVAALWLVFEIVRFGRPFASYSGERFSHPVLDGLWRLTVGPNKGLFLYFPLALLAVPRFRAARPRAARCSRSLSRGSRSSCSSRPRPGGPGTARRAGARGFSCRSSRFWPASRSSSAPAMPARRLPRALRNRRLSSTPSGALQPDGALAWYYAILKPRPLSAAERSDVPGVRVRGRSRDRRAPRSFRFTTSRMHAGRSRRSR